MGSILYGTAIHIREQAKIDAARITQKSGNERRGAESALARFSASLANSRIMDAAGDQLNVATENLARNLDATTYGTLGARVAAAEELGASTALAASLGMGGSSVEAYNKTIRLHQALDEEQQASTVRSSIYDASRARGQLIGEAVASFDTNRYMADLDYTQLVDHHKQSTLSKIFTLGAAAAATYVTGSPQAGMAVVGLNESRQAARNGDFATASSEAMGALSNGFNAYKDYHKTHGGPKRTGDTETAENNIVMGQGFFRTTSVFGARLHI